MVECLDGGEFEGVLELLWFGEFYGNCWSVGVVLRGVQRVCGL